MKSTVDKYGKKIQEGAIDPTRNLTAVRSGPVFAPGTPATPLEVLGFGAYRMAGESEAGETRDREYVFCPMEGTFTVTTGTGTYELARVGGPFAAPIGESSASALYVPRDSRFRITGTGEMVYYTAPSSRKMKTVHIRPGDRPNLSRGDLFWRRDVVMLIEPGVSTNLNIGETYSPPGLWSGTPPHIHDARSEELGESEHEEVYYHRCRMTDREMPNYTVQLMFDGRTMNRAFLCPDRTAVAIPGGCHPVVASPVSDCLYSFGLAGVEGSLGMRDLEDFSYLKKVGDLEGLLREENQGQAVVTMPRSRLAGFIEENALDELQARVAELILREWGITFRSG